MTPNDWTNYLDKGEEILWQGAPRPDFKPSAKMIFPTVFAIFFTGFSIFWMAMAMRGGGVFWMFGLIFFFAGLGQLFTAIYLPTFRRRHSFYTLTNRRAFIATNMPFVGRKLKSYPIETGTNLELALDPMPSVFFATKTKYHRTNKRSTRTEIPIGFEFIDDASTVYRLMRDIQNGEAA